VRDIGDLMPHRVEGAPEVRAPFFSPDGLWIGYYSGGPGLKKIPTAGGTPIEIVSGQITVRGASWTEDGTIVYATTDPETGLLRVSDAGGTPTVLTKPNSDQGEADHVLPFVLPGGRGICSRFWMRWLTIRESASWICEISRRRSSFPAPQARNTSIAGTSRTLSPAPSLPCGSISIG
jgi:hypothetical protein